MDSEFCHSMILTSSELEVKPSRSTWSTRRKRYLVKSRCISCQIIIASWFQSKSKPARNSPVKLGVVLPSRIPRPTPVKMASVAAATAGRARTKVKGARGGKAMHESPTAFPVTGMRRRQAFVGKCLRQ